MNGKIILTELKNPKQGMKVVFNSTDISQIETIEYIGEGDYEGEVYLEGFDGEDHFGHDELATLYIQAEDKIFPIDSKQWLEISVRGLLNKNVEFKIEKVYVEPPPEIHCNLGGDIDVAKIIFDDSEKLWQKVEKELSEFVDKGENLNSVMKYIKRNFKPITK